MREFSRKSSGFLTRNGFTALSLCLVLCCQAFVRLTASMTPVYGGADFVDALVVRKETELVLMNDIVLNASDFYFGKILTLERNVTIEADNGTLLGSRDAVLDFNYIKQKIRLGVNVTLTMRHLVISRFRQGSISASPGFDLLAPAAPAPAGSLPARVVLIDCMVLLPWCYPPDQQSQNINLFQRPPDLPGNQSVILRSPQTGCINDTRAPARTRCWPSVGLYRDFGLIGADLEMRTVPNNYSLWLLNTNYACGGILPSSCVAALTPLGCLYKMQAGDNQAPPQPGGQPSGAGAAKLGAALGGALGGAALLALVAVAVVLRVRQVRRCGPRTAFNEPATAVGIFLGATKWGAEVGKGQGGQSEGSPRAQELDEATDDDTLGRPVTFGQRCDIVNQSESISDRHVVVTPLTPPRPDLVLGVECGSEVVLLPVLRGKGSFGRVVEGIYGGQRVAVKLLPCDVLLPRPMYGERQKGDGEVELGAGCGGGAEAGAGGGADCRAAGGGAGRGGKEGGDVVIVAADTANAVDVGCGVDPVSPPPEAAGGAAPRGVSAGGSAGAPPLRGEEARQGPQEQQEQQQHHQQQDEQQRNEHQQQDEQQRDEQQQHDDQHQHEEQHQQRDEQHQRQEKQQLDARRGRERCARELRTFAQEVEVLGRCQHPNVVRLLAACLGPPQPCLVMELMETSLDRLLHAKDAALLPLPTVLVVAVDIARGLEYLHPTVVHRDLKPANVLVNVSGPVPVAKLSDFGLSRMRSTVIPTKHPEAGTPAYMAPECFDTANTKITHQADIYSFAVIVWEMLTGLLPWHGCTPLEVAYAVTLLGDRLPLHSLPMERCPAALSRMLAHCFDAEPRRRPAAAELVKELEMIAKAIEADPWSSYTAAGTRLTPNGTTDAAAAIADAAPSLPPAASASDAYFTNPARTLTPASLDRMLVGSSFRGTST